MFLFIHSVGLLKYQTNQKSIGGCIQIDSLFIKSSKPPNIEFIRRAQEH